MSMPGATAHSASAKGLSTTYHHQKRFPKTSVDCLHEYFLSDESIQEGLQYHVLCQLVVVSQQISFLKTADPHTHWTRSSYAQVVEFIRENTIVDRAQDIQLDARIYQNITMTTRKCATTQQNCKKKWTSELFRHCQLAAAGILHILHMQIQDA